MATSMIDALLAGQRVISKHEGPGPHPGTGSPQDVHSGGQPGAEEGAISTPFGMEGLSVGLQTAIQDTVAKREKEHGVDLSPETLGSRLRMLWGSSYRDDRERFERERRWYQGANEYGTAVGEAFNADGRRSAGILAALSPQTAWGRNQDMAADLMAILYEDPVVLRPNTRNKRIRLSEMSSKEAAHMLAGLDNPALTVASGDRYARLFDQSEDNIRKAIEIYRGDDIDGVLGGSKVRSFFNNIWLPDRRTSWTDDTHMKRIWLNDPSVSGGDKKLVHMWASTPTRISEGYSGPGMYPYFATIGSDTASDLGVLPHEVQAVTWSQWRRMTGVEDRDNQRGMADLGEVLGQLETPRSQF